MRAWLKVTQQLALGADLLAWGPGSCPPLWKRDVIIYQGSLIMNEGSRPEVIRGSVLILKLMNMQVCLND